MKQNPSVLAISPALVQRLLPKKEDRETVLAQSKGNPQLVAFLCEILLEDYVDNIFTQGYNEERAFADGKAYEARKILEIVKGLENG